MRPADRAISTHALREEGDPRPLTATPHRKQTFLPTPSVRRATRKPDGEGGYTVISTHALREEGDDNHHIDAVRYATISTHALREEGD